MFKTIFFKISPELYLHDLKKFIGPWRSINSKMTEKYKKMKSIAKFNKILLKIVIFTTIWHSSILTQEVLSHLDKKKHQLNKFIGTKLTIIINSKIELNAIIFCLSELPLSPPALKQSNKLNKNILNTKFLKLFSLRQNFIPLKIHVSKICSRQFF